MFFAPFLRNGTRQPECAHACSKTSSQVLFRRFSVVFRVGLVLTGFSPVLDVSDVAAEAVGRVHTPRTSETLKRMWCAAEIAAAWAGHTNIVPSAGDDRRRPPLAARSRPPWTGRRSTPCVLMFHIVPRFGQCYECYDKSQGKCLEFRYFVACGGEGRVRAHQFLRKAFRQRL